MVEVMVLEKDGVEGVGARDGFRADGYAMLFRVSYYGRQRDYGWSEQGWYVMV